MDGDSIENFSLLNSLKSQNKKKMVKQFQHFLGKETLQKDSNVFVKFPQSVWVCATNFLVPQKPQKFWSSENKVIIPAGATTETPSSKDIPRASHHVSHIELH